MEKMKTIRWQLVLYDLILMLAVEWLLLIASGTSLTPNGTIYQILLVVVPVFAVRFVGDVYGQIWRYGGIQCYIRLLVTDAIAFLFSFGLERLFSVEQISFSRMLAASCMILLGSLAMRMIYRYAFKCGNERSPEGRFLLLLLRVFAGKKIEGERNNEAKKTSIAIVGAGRVGVSLAEELINNAESVYVPRCFVDISKDKAGREIHGIPVFPEEDATLNQMRLRDIQEVVLAIPSLDQERKKSLYAHYKEAGYRVKVYDFPTMQTAGGKRNLREFDIEELLFRKPILVIDPDTVNYYKDKTILITGGGGSIGSELCRQLAKMSPHQIIILDIYENGAYNIQQELKIAYGGALDIQIEIMSITNKAAMESVFKKYRPQIVIHAAAHKHVPLMEHNCVEAVENNIFGARNVIELCEENSVDRFMLVSTDKAVNPTNVMGATKRFCEMMAQSASMHGKVTYSATRFGNVLGSAGSVIPLFKSQIASGGPVTLTDKRIVRYFMTIPEASQLVLESGAMAKNGEVFVLDMGQPVRILDLANNMIQLSGAQGIEIIETGLRPGEKLYEELLVKKEELDKTENSLIFIERDTPISEIELERRMEILQDACRTQDDDLVRTALQTAVPTYRDPEEVNTQAEQTQEMNTYALA